MLIEGLRKRFPLPAEAEPVSVSAEVSVHRAGIALLFVERSGGEHELLFTRRARHLNSHPGQVAFPGGKWEPGDRSLRETTQRELHEEIRARPDQYRLFGLLPEYRSRAGICVRPYLGIADDVTGFGPGDGEIDALFWVPVRFFSETPPARIDHFDRQGLRTAPAWIYGEYEIWGMTARIVADLVERAGSGSDRLTGSLLQDDQRTRRGDVG